MDNIEDDPVGEYFDNPPQTTTPLTNAEVVLQLPDEDSVLAIVHHEHTKIVKELTKQGVPQDKGDRTTLLMTLKDMSTNALTRKRIKADETKADADNALVQTVLAKLLTATPNNASQTEVPTRREIPTLSADIPPPVMVEGETATSVPQQSYDTFVASFPRSGNSA